MKNLGNLFDEMRITEPPSTLDGWERLLVKYFLAVGGDGDSSDLHAFEVSTRTLAIACGLDTQEIEVEKAFHEVLVKDPSLENVLQVGAHPRAASEVPGFFVYLVLTLFIDGLLDEHQSISGAFRKKLASWLGIDRSFNDLQGIATMWKALEAWLAQRVAAGEPFRRLVLPDPGGWHQIGHTRRLSFPTRHDFRIVENFVSENSIGLDSPTALFIAFQPLVNDVSDGLKDAFEDFRRSYYLHRRALADHRFWRLITRVRSSANNEPRQQAILQMTFNDYGESEFRRSIYQSSEMQSYVTLGAALADTGIASSSNFVTAINQGYLFFRQIGMGLWQAEANLTRCNERVFVALSTKIQSVMGMRLGSLLGDSTWRMTTEAKSINAVETAFAQVRLLVDAGDSIFRPTVFNGIRVYGRWLGLPGFLPSIETDSSQITLVAEVNDAPVIDCNGVGNIVRLVAEEPLNGTYSVEPELRRGEYFSPWRLRLQFISHALPHSSLSRTRQRLQQLKDWDGVVKVSAKYDADESPVREFGSSAMKWLLEAVYADGYSGWDEADLVSLVRRTAVDFEADPWMMLHLLQDAGIIEPRLRQGWKGRVWTLVPPHIVRAHRGENEVALVEGALCFRQIEDFNLAVEGLGGSMFRHQDDTRWSAPVIGASNLSSAILAERLGWPLALEVDSASKSPLALASTERQAEYYRISSVWCWNAKRFVSSGAVEDSVRLTRRSHRNGTDHDVFCVEHIGRSFNYLSRCAAITHAHALAKVPLFRFHDDRIERIAQDGALPDILASALRRRRLRAAGMTGGVYSYPATESDARWILSLLPGCIAGIKVGESQSAGSIMAAVRRSKGRLRAGWKDNQLVIQMNKSTRGFNGS
ncbi:hypothetical protein [Collimonas sp.]|uniref:hypothetical protein n=1 Tax=Collimonas sp. TaxID=1963772 RepID=UPI002C50EA00|nr:hypothetical protein [Collimonas sp.]HWW05596.1 hypothetical protein [Collimonas sp.]